MTDTLPTPADSIASPEFDESQAQAVDALIVGAGPVGMFAAFQLGLQGLQAHLCDSLPQMGGQCIALYADKPIYDIPGIALCTGRELAAQLQRQIQPFQPVFHGQNQVAQLLPHGDGRWRVQLQAMDGPHTTWLLARTVLVTAGVGAFVPKQLRLEGLDAWLGSQVFYHPALDDEWLAPLLAAHPAPRIVVNGGDESALEAILAAAAHPALQTASLVLMHRREQFNAPEVMLESWRSCAARGGCRS